MKKLFLFLLITLSSNFVNAQVYKGYYGNGQLKDSGEYNNKIKKGEWKFYQENGKLSHVGGYENGDKK